ncbi:hypothetical protein M8J75_003203 [Diaphorina citri]|nr:hypothetical protein M8J75_003203 [Diaphorina citri]
MLSYVISAFVCYNSKIFSKGNVFSTLIKYLMWFGVRLLLILIWPLTRIRSLSYRHKPLPPITNQLLLNSAQKTALLIRTKQVSCVKVVEAFITRIRQVNPMLNAVVDERFNLALEEAKQVDILLAASTKSVEEIGRDTPLLGVPLTVKESVAVKGCSNNAGRIKPKERIATDDAETVRLLRQAGAIILCVTNTPELCMNWETFNKATGTTNNPYDTRRTPGGSSGGEPWTQEEEEADVEMEVDPAEEDTSSNIQTKVPGKMKVVGQQRKRGRSPVQESREKTKKKVISGQSSLSKFITKHGMRERSHSLGSLGPEVAKIVDKLESSEESRGENTQEKNQNVKEKKTQEENKKPDNTQTNKDENKKEGDTKEVED